MSLAPPRFPEPGESLEVTHRFSLPSHENPPRVCAQFGPALITFGRARLEALAGSSEPARRLLAYAHAAPDNIVSGEVLDAADLLFLEQQLECGQASVANLRMGMGSPIPDLFITYIASNDPLQPGPCGSVLLQARSDGARFPFLLFSRPWYDEDGGKRARHPVDAVLTIVERLAAVRPAPPAPEQVQAIAGVGLENRRGAKTTYHAWTDPRPHSLLETCSWHVPWPDKSAEVRVELKVREGLPGAALKWRWGASTDVYFVSPTHQGSGPRQQNLWTETFDVRGVEVFVEHAYEEVNSMELRWPG